jgi:hypothetical protein
MDVSLESLLSIALGIGLAAAAGFRIFVPLLAAGIAARTGFLPLTDGFQWLGSTPALLMLGTAAVAEVLAYYIPGVDHVLDIVAGPAAVGAGVVASASVMADIPQGIMWPLAIIAGGGVAGLTKGTTALLRAKSGVMTAGLANPVVATVETASATGITVLALVVPLVCLAAIVGLLYWATKRAGRLLFGRNRGTEAAQP